MYEDVENDFYSIGILQLIFVVVPDKSLQLHTSKSPKLPHCGGGVLGRDEQRMPGVYPENVYSHQCHSR